MRLILFVLAIAVCGVAHGGEFPLFRKSYVRAARGVYIEAGVAPALRNAPRVGEAETRPTLAQKQISPLPGRRTELADAPQRADGWLTSSQ